MEDSKEDVAKRKEILLEEGLTQEEYDSVMRRRCHDAWLNEVITSRGLRSKYSEWVMVVFIGQLVATNVILFVCAVFGHAAPAIVAGILAGVAGLVATVTKYLFSAESAKMANDLMAVVGSPERKAKE